MALEWPIPLGAVDDMSEGGAQGLWLWLGQAKPRGSEKQGIDAAAQRATSGFGCFPYDGRALTEEVHDKIAGCRKGKYVG